MKKNFEVVFTYHFVSDVLTNETIKSTFFVNSVNDAYFNFGLFVGKLMYKEDKIIIDNVSIVRI